MAAPRKLSVDQEAEVYQLALRHVAYRQIARHYDVGPEVISRSVERTKGRLVELRMPELEALRFHLFDELDAVKAEAWRDSRELKPGMARNGSRALVVQCVVEQARIMGLEKLTLDVRHELVRKVDAWLDSDVEAPWIEHQE